MPQMDFSNASLDDLRVPEFESDVEKQEFLDSMFAGEVPIPITYKAMGVDFTDEEYVAEAIRLRLIGVLSAAAPNYRVVTDDMSHMKLKERRETFLDTNDKMARKQVDYVHERHPYGIMGGNVMMKLTGYSRSVDVYGKSKKVDLLCAGAGIPTVEDMRQMEKYPHMGCVSIVSSSTAARWVYRLIDQNGIDIKRLIFCVELPQLAGGHLGAPKMEDLEDPGKYDPEIIRAKIKKFAPEIPCLLAGGIAYRDQLKRALEMGYQGGGIGIRGLLTQESKLADHLIKDIYLNPNYKTIVNGSSPTGYLGRYLDVPGHTNTPEEWAAYVRYAVKNCISCIEPGECLFLKEAGKDPSDVEHFCIWQDLSRTRLGKKGGVCFSSTERDTIMHDEIYSYRDGNPRVPSMEESFDFWSTHDSPVSTA
ncbi:nitronate monooxygenase [Patescibacteria group bacterium]|nr:nitronate monooxygenase [Patescibacteria group bacterium]